MDMGISPRTLPFALSLLHHSAIMLLLHDVSEVFIQKLKAVH
jgi:hypothetical protein